MKVRFPDGVEVQGRPIAERERSSADRDYGLYLDPAWEPSWPADEIEWPDYGTPLHSEDAARVITNVYRRAMRGERVEVGCLGGRGRTGTVLACFAVLSGVRPADAIDWIRKNYSKRAVENDDQEKWVAWFGEWALQTGAQTRMLFHRLDGADLIPGAIYEGGSAGHAGDDPIGRLLPCGNMGGFRYQGGYDSGYSFVVLYTSLADRDWPDAFDWSRGRFTYYGDNKRPGARLLDTPRGGNRLLRTCFDMIGSSPPNRAEVPPFFVFSKAGSGRDVRFNGLAVPGAPDLALGEALQALKYGEGDGSFENYRATFTILDVPSMPRQWIDEILARGPHGGNAPSIWLNWVRDGRFAPLRM